MTEEKPKTEEPQTEKILWDNNPVKDFSEEMFRKIIVQETEGLFEEEKIAEYWKLYQGKPFKMSMIINKAKSFNREMDKITARKKVVLFASRDHEWWGDVTNEETSETHKEKKKPFQSFVTYYDWDKKCFGNFSIKGSPKLKARNIEWGKLCIVGISQEKSKNKKTGADVIYENLLKVESYVDEAINLEEDIFKKHYILGEHITKDLVDKHPMVVIYGEIDKLSLVKDYIPETEESIPISPYARLLDGSGGFSPVFSFSIMTPKINKNAVNANVGLKVIKMKLTQQWYGRPVLQLDGWDDALAREVAQLDKKPKKVNTKKVDAKDDTKVDAKKDDPKKDDPKVDPDEIDTDKMETDLNDYLGGGLYKVFCIGSLGSWTAPKAGTSSLTVYVNINPTYVVQTQFIPDKLPTKEESLAKVGGKSIPSEDKTKRSGDLRNVVRKNLASDLNATYDTLEKLGIFKEFIGLFPKDTISRLVEKLRVELKAKGSQPQDKPPEPVVLTDDDLKIITGLESELGNIIKQGTDAEIESIINKACEKKFASQKLSLVLQHAKIMQLKETIKKTIKEASKQKSETKTEKAKEQPMPPAPATATTKVDDDIVKGFMNEEWNITETCPKCKKKKNNTSELSGLCYECDNPEPEPEQNPEDIDTEVASITNAEAKPAPKKELTLAEFVNDVEGKNDDPDDPTLAEIRSRTSLSPIILKIARFIYKNDIDNTGVDRKSIMDFFGKEAKLNELVTNLKAMISEYKMLHEPRKGFYSLIF